jgi:hypothetical protein
VRARVLPVLEDVLGPGVAVTLARTADLLREDADLLDELAGRLLDEARVADPADAGPRPGVVPVVLDTEVLRSAPVALRRRALRHAAVEAGSPAGSLFASHVATLDAMITDWRGQGPAHLPGDLRALRTRGRLFLRPARTPSPERTVPAETPAEPAQE